MRISDWSSDVCSSDLLKDRPSVRGEAALLDLTLAAGADPAAPLADLKHITDQLLVRNPSYRCSRCGFGARSHHWQCPSCKEWGTIQPLLDYAVTIGRAHVSPPVTNAHLVCRPLRD